MRARELASGLPGAALPRRGAGGRRRAQGRAARVPLRRLRRQASHPAPPRPLPEAARGRRQRGAARLRQGRPRLRHARPALPHHRLAAPLPRWLDGRVPEGPHARCTERPALPSLRRRPRPAATPADRGRRFTGTVRPFLERYCSSCHGGEKAPAQLDLSLYASVDDVVRDHARWAVVVEKLAAKEMPARRGGGPRPAPARRGGAPAASSTGSTALRRSEARDARRRSGHRCWRGG